MPVLALRKSSLAKAEERKGDKVQIVQ